MILGHFFNPYKTAQYSNDLVKVIKVCAVYVNCSTRTMFYLLALEVRRRSRVFP